jgi:hypothetical protein
MSAPQKYRQRQRLRAVDKVVETLSVALAKKGETLKSLELWKTEMPTEAEMQAKDKYTMFDRKAKRYRKGIHSTLFSGVWDCLCAVSNNSLLSELPKWTRVSQRINPPGF